MLISVMFILKIQIVADSRLQDLRRIKLKSSPKPVTILIQDERIVLGHNEGSSFCLHTASSLDRESSCTGRRGRAGVLLVSLQRGRRALGGNEVGRSREVTTNHTTLPDELNEFYARFEALNPDRQRGVMTEGSTQNSSLAVTSVEVCKALKRINPRKAAGPDNIPGRALKVCSSELAGVFVDIFNLSLAQSFVPSCFKLTTIVPLPKKSVMTCLNDYRPVALTPIVMKCFERIVMSHIQETIPDTLDRLQFAYRQNRSTDDAVNTAIHAALTHPEGKDTYVRMLFIDYRSAFKLSAYQSPKWQESSSPSD
ncbi:hypothetical protein NFI96_007000 [Prochilodus magdalenae]|nr:hypothetical protein NFI96_007000 [Prochilodus magdalenae]